MPACKIVHLTTVHHPHDTRILYRECASLADKDYEVTLLVCSDEPVYKEGIEIITFPLPTNRIKRMTTTAFRFLLAARQLDADVYHFHDPELAPWMLILKIFGKKVIFDVHENIISSISNKKWIPKILQKPILKLTQLFLPLLMQPFDIIFAERSYPAAYPWIKNYKIVCNFPKLQNFPEPAQDKFENLSLIYIGSITEERGLLDMLDALQILQQQSLKVDLYLAGKPHIKKNTTIDELINQRQLKNVHFLGYIPQPEALKIASRCHVGLAVLHPVKNYLQSYPTKIFEYMGCNLPFITSNFPLYQEIVDKWQCGETCSPNNPTELAKMIKKLFDNKKYLDSMGLKGAQAVKEEYSWAKEENVLLSMYQEIINR